MNVGVCLAWWTTGCAEVPKSRFLAHLDRDPLAEGRDLLLDVDRPPYANGHKCPVWDIGDVHGHDSARAERVSSGVFWGESKSGRSHSQTLSPDGDDDV